MFKKIGSTIEVTRADTFNITLKCKTRPFESGDSVTMSVKKKFEDTEYIFQRQAEIVGEYATISVFSADTDIEINDYVYDIQFDGSGGERQTIVVGTFRVTPEVTVNG